jgi:atypical protein kinase C iota type
MYRTGARRWEKTCKIKGHTFVAKRLHRNAICYYCGDRIWGLGRQGLRCESCPLLLHKKCHKFTLLDCGPNILSLLHSASTKSSDDSAKLWASTREASSYNEEAGNIENSANTGNDIELSTKNGQVIKSSNNEEAADIVIGKTRPISIDDFDLIRVIGRGNFAKVLMAELKSTGKIYALQVVKKESMLEDEDNDWVQVEKNVFEICSNHPFLVGLHSCFQSPSRLFYAIEFVQGGDLLNLMNNRRKLPETDARFYTAELCLALNFLHSNGIIYRDLKLDNVLLAHDGHIKLTDYGMCKQGIKLGEKASTFCGTPLYMAPEILNSEDYSFSVDWWALGIILYEMLVGRNPWDSDEIRDEDEKIQHEKLKFPSRSNWTDAQQDLCDLIDKLLEKDASKRLGSGPGDYREILKHPVFQNLDIEKLTSK